jgi:hypothetical protein
VTGNYFTDFGELRLQNHCRKIGEIVVTEFGASAESGSLLIVSFLDVAHYAACLKYLSVLRNSICGLSINICDGLESEG